MRISSTVYLKVFICVMCSDLGLVCKCPIRLNSSRIDSSLEFTKHFEENCQNYGDPMGSLLLGTQNVFPLKFEMLQPVTCNAYSSSGGLGQYCTYVVIL